MANQIELTSYDSVTKRYVARLTVTEAEKVYQYTCEGTWHPEDVQMVAGALYDQHKAVLGKETVLEAEKQAITTIILAEVDKQSAEKAA